MDIKAARRTERFGGTTCAYWLAGRCNRNPCRFLHRGTPSPYYNNANASYQYTRKPHSSVAKAPKYNSKAALIRKTGGGGDGTSVAMASQKPSPSLCRYWLNGNCVHGDQCQNLDSWFYGDGFSTLAKFKEHTKIVCDCTSGWIRETLFWKHRLDSSDMVLPYWSMC